jgi:catalase
MQGVPEEIKRRQIALFAKCDPAYGAGVAMQSSARRQARAGPTID